MEGHLHWKQPNEMLLPGDKQDERVHPARRPGAPVLAAERRRFEATGFWHGVSAE